MDIQLIFSTQNINSNKNKAQEILLSRVLSVKADILVLWKFNNQEYDQDATPSSECVSCLYKWLEMEWRATAAHLHSA